MYVRTLLAALCAAWCCRAATAAAAAEAVAGGVYDVESTVLVSELDSRADVGFQLRAELTVRALPSHQSPHAPDHTPDDLLLRFDVSGLSAAGRGAAPRAEWAPRALPPAARAQPEPFYAVLRAGRLHTLHLPPDHPPLLINYQRSIASLFQFQLADGERNETDVSGACAVLYETVSPHHVRKIKKACRWEGSGDAEGAVSSRRVTRYSLGAARDALEAVHAEEVHEVAGDSAPLKVRAWTRLTRLQRAPPAAPAPASLPPAAPPAAPPTLASAEEPGVGALLREGGAGWGGEAAGAGGGAAEAREALRVLSAARRATQQELGAALEEAASGTGAEGLTALVRAAGLAGTRAAHAAAGALLQLRGEPLEPLAHVYLAALALAPHPHEDVVRDLLRLAGDAPPALRAPALLAAAAAARRLARAAPDLPPLVRDAALAAHARCPDDPCRADRLAALGNLRRADAVPLLLEHAERAPRLPALAALHALHAAPPDALAAPAALRRLLAVALQLWRPRALAVRGAALDLLVERGAAHPGWLAVAARAVLTHAPVELRRVLWDRVRSLPGLEAALRPLLPRRLLAWPELALGGTSGVVRRAAGWGARGWAAGLEARTLAAGGLLQAATVRLDVQEPAPAARAHPALALHVWTAGLAALAPAAPTLDPADGAEDAAAGLQLEVGGAWVRALPLFSGQGELAAHVWAGTASEPTPVLRALLPLRDAHAAIALLTGDVLTVRARAAAALALDAQVQVSLWSRTAAAQVELRGAVCAESSAEVVGAAGEARGAARGEAEGRLHIAVDTDFYDAVSVCARAALHHHEYRSNVTLTSVVGARGWVVRRARAATLGRAGHSLALGRGNDAACRALAAPTA